MMEKKGGVSYEVQSKVDFGFDQFKLDKEFKPVIKDPNVDYDQLHDELSRLIDLTKRNRKFENFHSIFLFGPTGVGKCFAPGTRILMYDGTIKNVEDIRTGDVVMGVNSDPKKVISTTSGTEMMYDIIPVKSDGYRVNKSHILSLKMTNTTSHGQIKEGEVVNISVEDYLQKSKTFKHMAKGYRVGVDFPEKEIPKYLTPYLLGLWLGDGNSKWISITNTDKEIIEYLHEYVEENNFQLIQDKTDEITYRITDKETYHKNRIIEEMRELNVLNNKHVPFVYKTNSRKIRAEILAGLIDSDGSYYHGCFDIIFKNKQLAKDTVFIARSLGLAAYLKEKTISDDTYYRICISGNIDTIPTKIKRKQAEKRKQKKDVLVTGISVIEAGVRKYYGFTLDTDDRRFLLEDFTVVHNSEICKKIAEENGCVYHKLEIQKIPIEEFEGFPYLEDREGMKVVRLAHPTVLPPSNDERTWVLHLDEFNKADANKMAAVMNLVLTGEIGGSADYNEKTGKSERYRLPERTVIIGSGNFKVQENTENLNLVNTMDIATSERFHRTMFLDYNAKSWLKSFALKEYSFRFNGSHYKVSSRIAPIVMYYIMDKMLEDGNKTPFLIPISIMPDEGGSERTASPRSWTLVSDNMLLDAIKDFEQLTDREEYEKKSAEIYGDDNRAFDLYFQKPQNQVKYIANQTMEFGLDGRKLVEDIISRYAYFAENRIMPDQILFEYKQVRNRVADIKTKTGVILYMLLSVGYTLDKIEKMNDAQTKIAAASISTFIEDTDISAEDLTAFIYILKQSKNEITKKVNGILININTRYKIAHGDFHYTSVNEIK